MSDPVDLLRTAYGDLSAVLSSLTVDQDLGEKFTLSSVTA